jgi:RecB family endonuclease NucS
VLPEALRLLMLKSDGSVMVHADTGGYKPQKCCLRLEATSTGVGLLVDELVLASLETVDSS